MLFLIFFSIALEYASQPYAEIMAIHPDVSYIPCDTTSRKKPGNIITLAYFEEGNLLSETRDNAESGDEYDDDSNMPP